jgi:hypothetical protein
MPNDSAIVLGENVTLFSLRNGDPDIHWTDPLTAMLGARGARLYYNVAAVNGTAQIGFFGRSSIDGRSNWAPWDRQIDGKVISVNPITTVGSGSQDYAADFAEFSPYVQFGIQVQSGAATQASVTLTALILPIMDDAVVGNIALVPAATALAASITPPTLIGTAVLVAAFANAVIVMNPNLTGGTATLYAMGSTSGSAGSWFPLVTAGTTIAVTGSVMASIVVPQLVQYLQLAYTSTAGTGGTIQASVVCKQV